MCCKDGPKRALATAAVAYLETLLLFANPSQNINSIFGNLSFAAAMGLYSGLSSFIADAANETIAGSFEQMLSGYLDSATVDKLVDGAITGVVVGGLSLTGNKGKEGLIIGSTSRIVADFILPSSN
jgi:hypothetical protein